MDTNNEIAIYKLHIDCGRNGDVDGIFIARKEDIKAMLESGDKIYFGEILGKHSDVNGVLEEGEDFSMLSDCAADVETVKRLDLEVGPNPVEIWKEQKGE